MTARRRFRDLFVDYTPWWLRGRTSSGLTSGYRYLWSMIAPLDVALENLVQGMQAAWPGLGTPTALALIGRTRGIIRGQGESVESYGQRLREWLDRWLDAGSAFAVARAIHEYLSSHPRVRVVTRSGVWVTIDENGTVTRHDAPFDWDSVSHPERVGFWSEMWIVVYPTQWALKGLVNSRPLIFDGLGFDHAVTREESDAIRGEIAQWKAAHTYVRSLIWSYDETLFDPDVPASCPDGTWGDWGNRSNVSRVRSGRNYTDCVYWEF